ncbi:hypothetical protein V8E53_001370 [Lactarius tabidus]
MAKKVHVRCCHVFHTIKKVVITTQTKRTTHLKPYLRRTAQLVWMMKTLLGLIAKRYKTDSVVIGWGDDQSSQPPPNQVACCNYRTSDNDSNSADNARRVNNADDFDNSGEDVDVNADNDNDEEEDVLSLWGIPSKSAKEHNSHWPRAPVCPPGSRQRNICINMQPEDFKTILKNSIRCLTRKCAFNRGYIPMDIQTDFFVELAVESATNIGKCHYATRLQKDSILQKEVCDLFNARVSLYCTFIKRIASSLVTQGYGLKEDQSTRATQVKEFIHNDWFIFEPKEDGFNHTKPFQHPVLIDTLCEAFFKHKHGNSFAQRNRLFFPSITSGPKVAMVVMVAVAVHASLEEKAMGIEFNADTYKDLYHTHFAMLHEIQERNLPAYQRLMSDLYKLAINQIKTHVQGAPSNAMMVLDLDGMDV